MIKGFLKKFVDHHLQYKTLLPLKTRTHEKSTNLLVNFHKTFEEEFVLASLSRKYQN